MVTTRAKHHGGYLVTGWTSADKLVQYLVKKNKVGMWEVSKIFGEGKEIVVWYDTKSKAVEAIKQI